MTTQPHLSVDTVSFEEIARQFGKSEDWVNKAMTPLLQKATLLGERLAREGAPKDTSALARSITSDVRPMFARIFTPLNYALPVEVGRRPGAKMPPPDALEGWARRHGWRGSLWELARLIARRGIKGRFFFRAAKEGVKAQLGEWMREAGASIGRDFKG